MAEDRGDSRARTVDSQRKIGAQTGYRPARDLFCGCEVDDRDLAGIRHVDEYPAGRRIDLKRFGMCGELDVADLRSFFGIDDREPATAVADKEIAGARIDADIVRVVTQRQAPSGREILAAIKANRTVTGAGHGH